MSSSTKYFPPLPQFTGRCQWQPKPEDTLSGWYFDRAGNYQESGFIDAPERTPTGSVRAMDIGDVCLGIDYQWRGMDCPSHHGEKR